MGGDHVDDVALPDSSTSPAPSTPDDLSQDLVMGRLVVWLNNPDMVEAIADEGERANADERIEVIDLSEEDVDDDGENDWVGVDASNMFTCKICSAAFTCRNSLSHHTNKHKDRKFECNLCNDSFTRNDSLNAHIKTVHKDKHLTSPYGESSEKTAKDEENTCNGKYMYRHHNNNSQSSNMDNDDEQFETDCESSDDMLERESGDDPGELVNAIYAIISKSVV
ncbi:PR domain zinc finger protein 15-like [Anoplophora glabripennis]|uniref:PR domain zinc finger protein 15-like n=1 Tax=Anoplophora glabripennis TaxID=217634 RepID=UPI000C75972B|nr:PR domain zinc finger protein 15-like [Anoplophora glabripennis]